MLGRLSVVLAAGLALALPGAAQAEWMGESMQGRWSLYLQGGFDAELAGKVHGGGPGTLLTLPANVLEKEYSEIYDTAYRGRVGLGYGISPRVELLATGSYTKVAADPVLVGDVGGLALNASFQDYEEISVQAGLRYYLTESRLKPYLMAMGGVSFIESNSPTFSVPAAGVTLRDTPFYDDSTVGTGSLGAGLMFDVTDRFALGVETMLRYQGRPSGLEGLAGTGLEPINDEGERWSMPVLATAAIRF